MSKWATFNPPSPDATMTTAINGLLESGMSKSGIAKEIGVHKSTIGRMAKWGRWREDIRASLLALYNERVGGVKHINHVKGWQL